MEEIIEYKSTNRKIIKQSHELTEAQYNLALLQKNILYRVLSQLQDKMSEKILTDDREIALVLPISYLTGKGKSNYRLVRDAISDLQSKTIKFKCRTESGKMVDEEGNFIYHRIHELGSETVTLYINRLIARLLLQLGEKNNFTSLNMVIAMSLPSFYSQRIYELCCRWKKTGFYYDTLENFRKCIGLTYPEKKGNKTIMVSKFRQTSELKKFVLEPAKRHINENSDLTFSYLLYNKDDRNKKKKFNWIEIGILEKSNNIQKKHFYRPKKNGETDSLKNETDYIDDIFSTNKKDDND